MPRSDCVFCKIIQGQVPAAKLIETDAAVAFLDIHPVAPGHALLVPREHYASTAEVPGPAMAALMAELPRLVRAVQQATGLPDSNVVINNGSAAGQEVDHMHVHVVPRSPNDAVRIHYPHGQYQGNALDEMRQRIQAALAGPPAA